MKQKINKFFMASCLASWVLLSLLLVTTGCQSNEKKLKNFVTQFNEAVASNPSNPNFTCNVEYISPQLARFNFRSTYDGGTLQTKMIQQTMEVMEQYLMTSTGLLKELVKDGIAFDIVCKGHDGSVLSSKRIHEGNIDSLSLAARQNSNQKGHSEMNILESMVENWNLNMPMEDTAAGVKIFGIELGDDHDVIYKMQYLDSEIEALLNDETVAFLKEEAMRNPAIHNIFSSVSRFGISKVSYHILSAKGEKIAEFTIDSSELRYN